MTIQSNYLSSFSSEEIDRLAQFKRVLECIAGDHVMRESFINKKIPADLAVRLKNIGVTFELSELSFFWESYSKIAIYLKALPLGCENKLSSNIKKQVQDSPLLHLWSRYENVKYNHFSQFKRHVHPLTTNSNKLDSWRDRRKHSTRSELGHFHNSSPTHPLYAFELSDGCSIGCWFCAFASNKLTGCLDYDNHKNFFCNITTHIVNLFGKQAARFALPYYSSEPYDNPNYLNFMDEFKKVTGGVLLTTTAASHDIEWLSNLIEYYDRNGKLWPRISVLSEGALKKIHSSFNPKELFNIQFVMQMKEQSGNKITGGRIFDDSSWLSGYDAESTIRDAIVSPGSVACISGFLINLVSRTIELVSPCYVSSKWPLGYRIHDKATFTDENDFPNIIQDMIDRNMHDFPSASHPLRFRDDLVYKSTEAGFDLISPHQIHHFTIEDTCSPLGDLIDQGTLTYEEIYSTLIENHNVNPIVLKAAILRLYNNGFINEVYCDN